MSETNGNWDYGSVIGHLSRLESQLRRKRWVDWTAMGVICGALVSIGSCVINRANLAVDQSARAQGDAAVSLSEVRTHVEAPAHEGSRTRLEELRTIEVKLEGFGQDIAEIKSDVKELRRHTWRRRRRQ